MHVTIVVPAKDEANRIERAIRAAAASAQRSSVSCSLLVYANDCSDETAGIARSLAGRVPLSIRVIEESLAPLERDAGRARRRAIDLALADSRCDAIVTTDADATLSAEALSAMSVAVSQGADVVCGRISTRLPDYVAQAPSIRRIDAASAAYSVTLHKVRFAIDVLFGRQPQGARPHYIQSAACMATSSALLRQMGGFPDVPVAEDRALVRAAEALGAVIRYCERANAQVSPRLAGRAAGGMADTIRARLSDPDPFGDEDLAGADIVADTWHAALSARARHAPPPAMPQADPRLRASDLERELPRLRAFAESEVAAWLMAEPAARSTRDAA